MRKELLVNVTPPETRVALTEDGRAVEVLHERRGRQGLVGNVFLGRVHRVLPGMQAAFVSIGLDRDAFLYVEDASARAADLDFGDGGTPEREAADRPRIDDLVKEGQEIVVQVTKDPLAGKGPRVTVGISLAGRTLVYLPGSREVGVSRRVSDEGERERLRSILEGFGGEGGYIARTAALGKGSDELAADRRYLADLAARIVRRRESSSPPSLLHRKVQTDTLGHYTEYSVFEGNIYPTPSSSKRSGSISFNLTNILEAKVFEKNDTSGKPKKVKIIDNFGISTSYNIFADSMRWSPVSMGLRTTLFNNIGISANSNFSLYGLNSKGAPIAEFAYAQNKKLMRLTSFIVSLDFDLGQLIGGDKNKKGTGSLQQSGQSGQPTTNQAERTTNEPNPAQSGLPVDEYGYAIFDVPWSMRVSYNFNYLKPAFKSILTQTLSVNGNVTLTKKIAVTYTSGYDFSRKEITMTQIGITRDLHCWTMSFNWIPNGTMKMWNFTIRVKAAVLADLKYERRKDFHDQYF